jgi:2-amino-4-hydroxy-6-hydroxymethyldihydropteridine diphosphokinase
MIIISLGANVTSRWGNAAATIIEAFRQLEREGISVIRRSALYVTTPFGVTDQPNFINAAALVRTSLPPASLLLVLKKIEAKAGRKLTRRWGPRALDLDIIDYKKRIISGSKDGTFSPKNKSHLILPHPETHRRAFVLRPLAEIAPHWHHPIFGQTAAFFLTKLKYTKAGSIVKTVNESGEAVECGIRQPLLR